MKEDNTQDIKDLAKEVTNILESDNMDKNTIRDWVNMILRLGGGLTLLLIGSVFMIDAVLSGRPYPDYVIVGGIIMGCGLASFIAEVVKQTIVKYYLMRQKLKIEKETTKRLAIENNFNPYQNCDKCFQKQTKKQKSKG